MNKQASIGIEVTDVSFSYAKEVTNGSCGFCRIIINGGIAINRVRLCRVSPSKIEVLLPRFKSDEDTGNPASMKPIVQLLDDSVVQMIRKEVLTEYHHLIEKHNGEYRRQSKFHNKTAVR